MKVRIQKWGHPTNINEGLEKEKNWYEYQLIEDRITEMVEEDFSQLICDEAERGNYLETKEDCSILEAGDFTYTFLT